MPENEFEKKIASEMMELKFSPSASVWPQVEERIRKKKKRRILIFIFLLAGLGLLGWWQWNNLFGDGKNNIATTESGQKNNTVSGTQEFKEKTSGFVKTEETKTETDKINKVNDEKADATLKENITQPVSPTKKAIKNTIATTQRSAAISKSKPEKKPNILTPVKVNEVPIQKNNNKPAGIEKDTISHKAQLNTDQTKDDQKPELKEVVQVPEQKIDSSKTQPVEEKKNVGEVNAQDSVLETPPFQDSMIVEVLKKKSADKKWKWGAVFAPGISSLNENGFSINLMKSSAADFQNSSGGSGTAAPQRQLPSPIKPGFAFQIGGFLQRDISRRSNISLGLQYGFYSHRLGIGRNRDSLLGTLNQVFSLQDVNAVYNAGGDTIAYHNRYHFLELPFRFQWQLNKNITRPMYWSFGFTASRLVGANTLQYDTAFNGIYYQNKKLISKTQFSLSTGFSFTIANNQKTQWSLGPFAQVHLNKLVDNPFENKKFLFFTGIRSAVIFKRK